MNREFKFRVWSKIKNRWLNSIVIGDNGALFVFYVEVNDKQEVINKVFTLDGFDPIIQQYTGLKDKNGKEIYEGDILKVLSKDKTKSTLGKVEWGEYGDDEYVDCLECWTLNGIPLSCIVKSWGVRYNGIETDPTTLEIVGNVFENNNIIST